MFKWLKSIFSGGTVVDVINETFPEPTKVQTKKKVTTKKKSSGSCDFDKLNKAQLLKEAKKRGVKANASLTKAEILSRVKNAK
jgi:hypothetical protein